MSRSWRWASPADLEMLVQLRLEVLRAANLLPADAPLPETEAHTRAYYAQELGRGCMICLCEEAGQVLAVGGVSFYQVMPTRDDPRGLKAYIMNMYTRPAFRRQGLAYQALTMLTQEASRRGVRAVSLEATKAGRPLYEAFGFQAAEDEMTLVLL